MEDTVEHTYTEIALLFLAIAEVGGVPFEILEPVLERCTPEQLYRIEQSNQVSRDEIDNSVCYNVIKCFFMQALARINTRTPTNGSTISKFGCILPNMPDEKILFKYSKTWQIQLIIFNSYL